MTSTSSTTQEPNPESVWHDLQHLGGLIRALQFEAQRRFTIGDNAS